MQPERPRARRYPFVASIELTDVQSEVWTYALTGDLSLFGCHVVTREPLPTGTKVRIRIVHAGASFVGLGKVACTSTHGMGVVLTEIEPNQQLVLEKWIAQLRDASA